MKQLHALAAALALMLVCSFLAATLVAELFLDAVAVTAVKKGIVIGVMVLIPAVIATGVSGFLLGRGRAGSMVAAKQRRMPLIALNGLLILLPAALFLKMKAVAGEFDALFYTAQAAEIAFGLAQLYLLLRNARTGRALAARG